MPIYAACRTSDEETLSVLESERARLERHLSEHAGRPWSSSRANAQARLGTLQREIKGVKGRMARGSQWGVPVGNSQDRLEQMARQLLAGWGRLPRQGSALAALKAQHGVTIRGRKSSEHFEPVRAQNSKATEGQLYAEPVPYWEN